MEEKVYDVEMMYIKNGSMWLQKEVSEAPNSQVQNQQVTIYSWSLLPLYIHLLPVTHPGNLMTKPGLTGSAKRVSFLS